MKFSKKIMSWCLALAMIMSLCTFTVAEAASITTLEATEVGSDYIVLSWSCDQSGLYYHINQNGSEIHQGYETTWTIKNLTPNTSYTWEVWAQNPNGWSWVTNKFITLSTAEALEPYAEITNRKSDSLTIKLYNVDEEGKYVISAVIPAASEDEEDEIALTDTEFTGSSYTHTGLNPATKYEYTIYSPDGSFDDITISGTTIPEYRIEATEVTARSVTLEWVRKENTAGHKLLVSSDKPGAKIPEKYATDADIDNVTTITVTGLSPETEYHFVVTPLDGSWGWMEAYKITVTTLESPDPYAEITGRTSNSLTVELYNVDEDEPYYITAEKEDGTVVLENEEFTGLSYTHSNLDEATKYTYTIKNADGTVNLTADGKTKPVYSITASNVTETTVDLSWVAVEDTAGYKIQISSSDGGLVPDKYNENNGNSGADEGSTTHQVIDLEPNHTYKINVVACRNGDWSWHYTYSTTITTLAPVEDFAVTRQGVNDLTMRWPAVEGAAYYNVYRVEDDVEVLVAENIDAEIRNFKDIWLKHDTEYTYVVKAFDENNEEIEITEFNNTLTESTAVNTKWNKDRGDVEVKIEDGDDDDTNDQFETVSYYTTGALAGQNIYHETYYSDLMDIEVGYNIHIPANYDPEDTETRYPVLYFLHPLGGDENSWVSAEWGATYVEVLQQMGDNMFIVYVNNASDQWYTDAANGLYYGRSTILYELIPHIDAKYNTIASKRGRALDGFSMGGVGSLILAFERPDMFNSVVTNSAGISNSLQDFVNMAWGSQNTVFGYDVDKNAANAYYAQESVYAVYEKNKDKIAECGGMNIIMRWGEIDPVALLSNQKMFDLLKEDENINITNQIIENYDHSGVYYDGRMWDNLSFHKSNLDFSGTAASDKEYKIGSVNPFLGDVFIEKGSEALASDAKLLVVSYGEDDSVIDCQLVNVERSSVKTDFAQVTDADYVKVFLWNMGDITSVCSAKTEDILQ